MSVDSIFFIRDDKLPSIAEWQIALDRANSGIILEDVGDLRTHSGYLPASHHGHPSGFEWYYGPINEIFEGDPVMSLGVQTHAINCVTHSDLRELACALTSAAVLSQLADGLYYDGDCDQAVAVDAALKIAKDVLVRLSK